MTRRPATPAPDRAMVLGCAVDRLDMAATVARCRELIRAPGQAQQVSVNAAKLVAAQRDVLLRRVLDGADIVSADGQSVVWASRLLGDRLPERVAGIDLMHALMAMAAEEGHRVFILGAARDVLETAVERLRQRYPGLPVAGYRDGYFSDGEADDVAETIRAARPDILFVAISSPRKEHFLGAYSARMDVPLAMGVGGSIDVVAGKVARAPAAWQRAGFEWLFRLLQEPRRMARRYAVTNTRFVALVAREMLRGHRGTARRDARAE